MAPLLNAKGPQLAEKVWPGEKAAGGGLACWPYPVAVFPRAQSAFPGDFCVRARSSLGLVQQQWRPNTADGFSEKGHLAATCFPRRDKPPKKRIGSKELLHRRFSVVKAKHGPGRERSTKE